METLLQKGPKMNSEQFEAHVRQLANSRCETKHPNYYDSLICVGPGSEDGFGPPCHDCIDEVRRELAAKKNKMHGKQLSPEEAVEKRKQIFGEN